MTKVTKAGEEPLRLWGRLNEGCVCVCVGGILETLQALF